MSKCWYCGKEIKNENNKEHIGICDKCYQESFEVGNKFISNLIEKQTDKDQRIADLEAKLAEQYKEVEKVETHYIKQREYYTKEFNEIIDNLKQQLATQENTITNLVEDNRASQEWYKKQLAEKEKELETYKKALTLAREYMFNVMCADDVPFESWFIECAKNNRKPS